MQHAHLRGLLTQVTCKWHARHMTHARSARVSCARVYIARACCMWQATCSKPTCVGCGWVTKDFACLMGRANQSVIVPPTWACVCGCGGGSCPSPLPGSWHRSNWRCESSRHSRDLRAPIRADQRSPGGAVTQGQPSYPFGPNHAVLSQGSWPRDRVLSTGFQPGCPFISRLYGHAISESRIRLDG